ncbi:MAG: putative glycoside hydrolase, partial [Patescibacteria group bacterium]
MMKWRNAPILGGVFLFAAGTAAIGLALPQISYVRSDVALETVFREPVVRHVPTPEMVKAVYMTQCVVGTPSFRAELIDLIENTELNAVVIDIKDYSGGIAFPSTDPALLPYVSKKCGAYDMEEFVKTLHEKGIYVIGRITVFQDPLYTRAHPEFAVKKSSDREIVWKDHKGLSFIDVGAKPFWDYIVTLSKASYALGFDELNFDYIRFPSDGDMKDIAYTWIEGKTKQESLEEFFRYLHGQLAVIPVSTRPAEWVPVMSADLFGMTATNYDDLNIGQVLERALPYFDYIDP